ncbi:Oidioi.mRNA.OKI2018_I69.chr2.g5798.t1.cds [Oikopleura dioica]|uniref:Oidioi.mRNA.OKI2018_I69.chr2.g5798.t1.cds n=1 Tax=Oikopleura dioica TaxID=34765 RepID=A0ABN7T1E4_OIKDI|nr:Oidioi.mRNA.OKI2018_I69.chr2.g5798.t1.cds [Oikopleura dioica]
MDMLGKINRRLSLQQTKAPSQEEGTLIDRITFDPYRTEEKINAVHNLVGNLMSDPRRSRRASSATTRITGSRLQSKADSNAERQMEKQIRDDVFLELECEKTFATNAFYFCPFIGFLARNRIKEATKMFDIGSYESCVREAKNAFKYATITFTLGTLIYFTTIISLLLYYFAD